MTDFAVTLPMQTGSLYSPCCKRCQAYQRSSCNACDVMPKEKKRDQMCLTTIQMIQTNQGLGPQLPRHLTAAQQRRLQHRVGVGLGWSHNKHKGASHRP